jgi:hypothetical protein
LPAIVFDAAINCRIVGKTFSARHARRLASVNTRSRVSPIQHLTASLRELEQLVELRRKDAKVGSYIPAHAM